MMRGEGSIRVLLVDDSEDDREFLRLALDESAPGDIAVSEAVDGREAVERLAAMSTAGRRPDFAIVDLKMPRMDGREFLREIRQRGDLQSMPVLILSTSDADEDIDGCYEDGCNAYFQKPLEYHELIDLVRELVGHWARLVHLPRR